jgi:hypothetical protein
VEVVFEWAGDRWRHRVLTGGVVRAESLEGPEPPANDPRWPASPVLTEVSLLDIGGRPAILGVGLAGRSHFSASITPHPRLADTLLFEIACRIQEEPGWLGTTYRSDTSEVETVRIAAPLPGPAGTLPRTVQWTYAVGPAGILGTDGRAEPESAPPRPA